MKRLNLFMLACATMFLGAVNAYADGLPANPWQNSPQMKTYSENNDDALEQASATVADIWSKVRDSEEFRQWSMPQQNQQTDENKETSDLKKQAQMISMLANLNQVGYKIPDDYQNMIKKMPQKTDNHNKSDYDRALRDWKRKYNSAKNNSLNILESSYQRVLYTIKDTTGVDVNRTINDSIRAFK